MLQAPVLFVTGDRDDMCNLPHLRQVCKEMQSSDIRFVVMKVSCLCGTVTGCLSTVMSDPLFKASSSDKPVLCVVKTVCIGQSQWAMWIVVQSHSSIFSTWTHPGARRL